MAVRGTPDYTLTLAGYDMTGQRPYVTIRQGSFMISDGYTVTDGLITSITSDRR